MELQIITVILARLAALEVQQFQQAGAMERRQAQLETELAELKQLVKTMDLEGRFEIV